MRPPGCDPSQHPGVDSSSSASAVFGAFMRAMHAHRQLMSRKMSAHGIPPAQMFCLREVAHNPGIIQRDLAEKLNVSRPTLTVMLHKMEKAGLIDRRADETDQRFTRIHLAGEGASLHDEMHSVVTEVVAEMVGPLCEPDRVELARLLGLLGDNMTATIEPVQKADR